MVVKTKRNDTALFLAASQGDQGAFEMLYRRYYPEMTRYFWYKVRSQPRAEELAQDTFMKLYRYREGYEPSARFRTWLYRIAKGLLLNEVRARSRDRSVLVEKEASTVTDMEKVTARRQEVRKVMERIDRLPSRQREAIVLVRFQGLNYQEAAQAMKVSERALKSLLNRGRSALLKDR
jgi:RNA polymerase sigma-70 factor, ECF subfamily